MTFRQSFNISRIFAYYNVDSSPGSPDSRRVEEWEPSFANHAGSKVESPYSMWQDAELDNSVDP